MINKSTMAIFLKYLLFNSIFLGSEDFGWCQHRNTLLFCFHTFEPKFA